LKIEKKINDEFEMRMRCARIGIVPRILWLWVVASGFKELKPFSEAQQPADLIYSVS
jgi:hypothetical protein